MINAPGNASASVAIDDPQFRQNLRESDLPLPPLCAKDARPSPLKLTLDAGTTILTEECRAGHVLAVSAMADCTAEGFSAALISNCATKTSTRDFCHSYSPRFVLSNKRSRSRPKGTVPSSLRGRSSHRASFRSAGARRRGYVSVPRQSYRSKPSEISVQVITV